MLNFNDFLDNEDIITEGIHDKHIFRAFYLAGGPGSGKSWVAAKTLEGSGMKVVNSDIGFENYAKKAGLDLKQMGDFTKDQTKLKDELRRRAKRGTLSMGQHAVNGRLGLIIDSTARDADKIESAASGLRYLGYQTYMIFVNTTLEVALERNQERRRSVPEPIVIQSHAQIQKQKPRLIRMFATFVKLYFSYYLNILAKNPLLIFPEGLRALINAFSFSIQSLAICDVILVFNFFLISL